MEEERRLRAELNPSATLESDHEFDQYNTEFNEEPQQNAAEPEGKVIKSGFVWGFAITVALGML
jgi:hypothetical protein